MRSVSGNAQLEIEAERGPTGSARPARRPRWSPPARCRFGRVRAGAACDRESRRRRARRSTTVTVPRTRGLSARPRSRRSASTSMVPNSFASTVKPARARVDRELADAQLVRAEAAGQRQRPSARVFQPQRLHGHAIRRELKRRRAVPVPDAGGGDEERGVLDADRAGEVRVACGADRPARSAAAFRSLRETGGQRFDMPRPTELDVSVTSSGPSGRDSSTSASGTMPDGGQPDAGRLVEPQIEAQILVAVIDAARQPLVAQSPNAALGDVDERHHGRAVRPFRRPARPDPAGRRTRPDGRTIRSGFRGTRAAP